MGFYLLNKHRKIYSFLAFLFTGLNGLAGVIGIFLVFKGEIFWPLRLIILGSGFDLLDGYFARKNGQDLRIGIYLDSFADGITYVLLPSFWILTISQDEQIDILLGLSLILTAFIYLFCGIYRLIRFVKNQTFNYFEGLPTAIAALIVGSLNVLIIANPPELSFFLNNGFNIILLLNSISLLMITHVKYPSRKSYSRLYNCFRILGYLVIGVFTIFPDFLFCFGIFLFFMLYTLIVPYFLSKQGV